jgi:hypothetical protein
VQFGFPGQTFGTSQFAVVSVQTTCLDWCSLRLKFQSRDRKGSVAGPYFGNHADRDGNTTASYKVCLGWAGAAGVYTTTAMCARFFQIFLPWHQGSDLRGVGVPLQRDMPFSSYAENWKPALFSKTPRFATRFSQRKLGASWNKTK